MGETVGASLLVIAGSLGLAGAVAGVRFRRTGENGGTAQRTAKLAIAIGLLALVVLWRTAR